MKHIYALTIAFLFISHQSYSQADVELRVIGGAYEDVASTIIPTPSGGVYALGSTSSPSNTNIRGYIVYYDSDFNYAWSTLTPYGSYVENIVDAILIEGTEDLLVLSKRLGHNGTYNTVVHHIQNLGTSCEFISSVEKIDAQNQTPGSLVNWLGNNYAIGETEGNCWMINIDGDIANTEYQMFGISNMIETIETARVFNDSLYVVGSSIEDGVEQATVWAWGASGSTLWANIGPNDDAYGFNYANDISPNEDGVSLLYTFQRPDLPMGNGIITFEEGEGLVDEIVSKPFADFYREGKKLLNVDGDLLKLAHVNVDGSNTDVRLVVLDSYGWYIDSEILGTEFDDEPVDMVMDEEGVIWILGTTYGYLNGSASFFIYRISSFDLIGDIDDEEIALSITDDPMLFGSVGIYENSIDVSLYPNPVSTQVTLSKQSNWTLYSTSGRTCATGFGQKIDLTGLPNGFYYVRADLTTSSVVLPFQIIN